MPRTRSRVVKHSDDDRGTSCQGTRAASPNAGAHHGVGFGALFGAAGFVEPDDRLTLTVMALVGLGFVGVGIALATSRARVSAAEIRYRNGLIRSVVPARDVVTFSVGPGSGAPPPRTAYIVERRGKRPVRLIGVKRWDSANARAQMTTQAARVPDLLGLECGRERSTMPIALGMSRSAASRQLRLPGRTSCIQFMGFPDRSPAVLPSCPGTARARPATGRAPVLPDSRTR